jgi:hypothetical protein
VKLPPSDAQSSRHQSDHSHSSPAIPLTLAPAYPPASLSSPAFMAITGRSGKLAENDDDDNHATDFAASSWDLATGGLKALTAKREVPSLVERRPSGKLPTTAAVPLYRHLFTVVILACLVVMLISGGVVLFLLTQP